MSTVKANNHQIGQSGTPSNNMTWYQPATPDGTIRLGVGNAGVTSSDVLIASSSGLAIGSASIGAERIVMGTAVSMSGASVGFTGIPSWAKKISLMFRGGNSNSAIYGVQIGSGSYLTSGYTTVYGQTNGASAAAAARTAGFETIFGNNIGSASGVFTIYLQDASTNSWVATWMCQNSNPSVTYGSGYISLAGALDRLQLYTTGGTFSAGSVNIMYEG